MRASNIGALPVGENDRLIGMVTDRDIRRPRRGRESVARKYKRARRDVGARLLVL
jgi:CBS domain-containing protein